MRAHGLKREDFAKVTSSVLLTKNVQEALRALRTERFVLALISGGIDTFMDEKIPDANQLFDYVCINRLHYDDQGVISRIDATPFDFAGKAVALEAICEQYGVSLAEAVFVGEGNNDESVANAAGIKHLLPLHVADAPFKISLWLSDQPVNQIR